MKLGAKDRIFYAVLYGGVGLFLLSVVYPFYFVVINSFNANAYWFDEYIWPKDISFDNYKQFLTSSALYIAFLMSWGRVVAAIPTGLFVDSMAAYVLRKPRIRIRKAVLALNLFTMYFGGGLIPMFMVIRLLGIYNTFWVYVLPGLTNFFHVIILMSVFNHEIPRELEDSARIDGANDWVMYSRIFIPLSVPVLATLALFEGVGAWNNWSDTVFFTKSPQLATLAAVLIRIIRQLDPTGFDIQTQLPKDDVRSRTLSLEGMRYATMVISIVPVLLIYPFMQKYFVKGIRLGAIKG